jgi:coatomer protein complex subunit alpha (xenin)
LDLDTLLRNECLATRHDNGIIMFKLKRERLAFVMQGGILYYIKEQHLHPYNFSTQKDNLLISIHNAKTITMNQTPRSLSYNVVENVMLLCLDIDMGSFVTR